MMTNVFFSHTVEKWVYPADAPPRTFSWCFVAYVEEYYSTLVKRFSFFKYFGILQKPIVGTI